MVKIPGKAGELRRELARFQQRYSVSLRDALEALEHIFQLSRSASLEAAPNGAAGTFDEGEIVITCEMCCDPAWVSWWQTNFGSWWREARWWYCGPFGQDCQCPSEP